MIVFSKLCSTRTRKGLLAAATMCVLLVALAPNLAMAQSNPTGQFDLTAFPEPYFLLLRDPVVHDELDLSDEQREKLFSMCYAQDAVFWRLRGGTKDQALTGLRKLSEALQQSAQPVLTKTQRQRLAQIQLQLAGFRAFLQPEVIQTLMMKDGQVEAIEAGIAEFQEGYQKLRKRQADGESLETLNPEFTQLQKKLRGTVVGALSNAQQVKWTTLVGQRVDHTKLGKVRFKAPPLQGATGWVNTSPLAESQLQGRVVALHFYAFQCINCKRNQPWYREWQAELKDDGLVVLGIHTPEVSSEREPKRVKDNAASADLQYPIVLDNDKQLWNAWGNTMWPTTYLIDKEGFVRYWWMGELNWKEAGMQEVFKKRIEELLVEQTS